MQSQLMLVKAIHYGQLFICIMPEIAKYLPYVGPFPFLNIGIVILFACPRPGEFQSYPSAILVGDLVNKLRWPTYAVELVETALKLREEYPRWGKDKLM